MPDLAPFLLAFTSIFVIVDPISNTVTFLGLTRGLEHRERLRTARRAVAVGCTLLILFALLGEQMLAYFGIDINYLRVAGGMLLLLVSVDMMQGRRSREGYTPEEHQEATQKEDFSVFPLAMPMLTGPGAITTAILLMRDAPGIEFRGAILGAILLTYAIVWLLFTGAEKVQKVLGVSGSLVILRVMGLFLAAIAIQYMAQGGWRIYRLVSA